MISSLANIFRSGLFDHPLALLSRDRDTVIDDTVEKTLSELKLHKDIDGLIAESMLTEKKRLESRAASAEPLRSAMDQAFWKDISSRYKKEIDTADQSEKLETLRLICQYHAKEISGNFDDRVYRLATAAVPRGLGWLLKALSWKSFSGMFANKVDLRRKIYLQGQTEALRRLTELGTVILVPTHFSNMDSVLVGWALYELGLPPFCYGAGLNLFTNPLLGFFMNNLGAYKVDRTKKHRIYKEVLKNYSTSILERGCHSLFFPGGGRSRSGALESKLKLGLLGTTIPAYVNNLLNKKEKSKFFIVPCVISYHFVLEAATLVDDFLAEHGRHRYIIEDDESSEPKVVAQFFYNFFNASSSIHLNFGQALDPFGNLVDINGESLSPSGRVVDTKSFVMSNGEVKAVPQRDQEYTKILGEKILERYHIENIALASHFVAFSFFEFLRQKTSQSDLFQVLRLEPSETTTNIDDFSKFAQPMLHRLQKLHNENKIQLEPVLRSAELKNIIESAARNVGLYHLKRPLKIQDNQMMSEDMRLLFYYHNRMEGYGLSLRDEI